MTPADVKQRLRNYRLPPQTLRELGLEDDWASNVSDEFIANVLAICERHEGLLRRLAKV